MISVSIARPLTGSLPKFIDGHIQSVSEKKINTQPQVLFGRIMSERRNLPGCTVLLCIGRDNDK
jgi:hypothetical protein